MQAIAVIKECIKVVTVNTSILHVAHCEEIPLLLLQNINYMHEHAQFPHIEGRDEIIFFNDSGFVDSEINSKI